MPVDPEVERCPHDRHADMRSNHPLFTQIGEPSRLWIDKDTFQFSAFA